MATSNYMGAIRRGDQTSRCGIAENSSCQPFLLGVERHRSKTIGRLLTGQNPCP